MALAFITSQESKKREAQKALEKKAKAALKANASGKAGQAPAKTTGKPHKG